MKILVVGSIDQSPFIQTDIDKLSTFCKVDTVNFNGTLDKDALFHQYLVIIKTIIFDLFPKSFNNDVIYVWFADVPAFFCLIFSKLFGKKLIVVLGGYEVCNMPEINYGLQRENNIRSKISRFVLRNTDHCIVPSSSYYKRTLPYSDKDKLVLLPTCGKAMHPEKIVKENYIVMVGNATDRDYLLKGIPQYDELASKINVRCFLIGNYDEDIRRKYHHIEYLGHVSHEDVIYIMSKAKIYCQLSYTESFGISILEAMSVGCIPVVSGVDNIKNFVTDDIPGLCVDAQNFDINEIHKLLMIKPSDYIEKIISNARSIITETCNKRKEGLKELAGAK